MTCPDWITNKRSVVDRFWARLEAWRNFVTRYGKTATSFIGVLSLAAAIGWIKRRQAVSH